MKMVNLQVKNIGFRKILLKDIKLQLKKLDYNLTYDYSLLKTIN